MATAYPAAMKSRAAMLLAALALPAAAAPTWGDQGDGTFRNPVLWMDYNNPCVIRHGDDFYLTAATHHYMGMPILKSTDLVNWTHAGRIYERLGGLSPDFTSPGLAYSAGSQDGEIGKHGGRFYLFNWSSRYRGFFCTAPHPAGPWTEPKAIRESIGGSWEDPCPFWDDDGKAYLLMVGNPGPLKIFRINETFDAIVDEGVTLISDIAPKGPQLIKRDGYYHLLVARTGPDKAQFAYRSKSLYGPYESKLIYEDRSTDLQAAQGSLVPVKGDAWAFLHHDYRMESPYGRRLYLQPAGWKDGWPWIGADPDGDGIGQPVGIERPAKKPDLPPAPIDPATHSDEFAPGPLGGQWMWNHDPDDRHWSLSARPGWLRLGALPLATRGGKSQYPAVEVAFHEDHLLFARNTAVQRICGKVCTITTKLDSARMDDGQRAGLCTLSDGYTWIGVARDDGRRRIVFGKGDAAKGPAPHLEGPALDQHELWLRLDYRDAKGTLSYSLDGRDFIPLGPRDYAYRSFWYEGTKVGLFSYRLSTAEGEGVADFDFLRQDHDGPRPAAR
jgi:beta-xylosidase